MKIMKDTEQETLAVKVEMKCVQGSVDMQPGHHIIAKLLTPLSLLPMGQTAFWRQKMRTHHQVIDINKDGVVSWDDFEVLIARFTELGHLSPKEISKFRDALRHVWEEEWGASGDPYIFIGQEQFLMQMEHVVNTKSLRKRVASPLPYFFNAVDRDGSGEISIEEFKIFYSCLGLSEQTAEESFASIDLNKDGKLSKKEFIKLGRDFFLTEKEHKPSKLFWGPLAS
ncbi:sarcoplasmic calcium-binding protein-like isoform X2 [Penaeus chinensis]|uniref:sarcoplasmic calcium-binding protein-like isoform X2 n=1 Tax=Penaeus chinensis TaxID=139456 RepID=UPI001FB67125|nr:sarcoplasmic calcium-binding protein-like isoform X2 [Penaeus chinensis]